VDEEQRFGVAHKERLKQLRTEVHVLTLSATPIPRTLNMALVGVRDMSVIETPPEDRLPIQTRVAEASAGLVRDALLRELDRGGQAFYVHNRVETIEAQAEQLRRLLPSARIVVGHGQMPEGALERVMIAFARGDHDILVCTTIIESGLDIPNANTIIIDRADALGLAQLYQLRGRVGRSSRRAYAYLLYRRRERLSDVARKRLQAVFNASELGAGFQIALADLEIRGAGEILGAEQHGHMSAVGFDLYTRMLAEAVEEEKAAFEQRPARMPVPRPSSTCPSMPSCPTTTSPTSPRSSSCTGGWAGWPPRPSWRACAPSWRTGSARCPRPWSGCSRWRACATPRRAPGSARCHARTGSWWCASPRAGHAPVCCGHWHQPVPATGCRACRWAVSWRPPTRCGSSCRGGQRGGRRRARRGTHRDPAVPAEG